ncbi:MAG: MmgE/PrpD family protein [Rhizobiaceae bacterium]|nr:MmgE/PrpD family protein [Rhizobiaceae bacterium]
METGLLDTVLELSSRTANEIPSAPRELALLSLYDWLLCGLAGRVEPVSRLVHEFARSEGGVEVASLIGGRQAPARMAALVNGTISHALDFDDTHFAHVGHLSVGIYPAALAAAEEMDASVSDMVDAYLLGAEAAIQVGMTLGIDHYNHGYHQTATAGAFGACIAAARLYHLDRRQTAAALGLCATRASGLKSQFGTMGKPYNAGIAASNGIETAKLAQLGFSAPVDGLMGAQGFVPTHSNNPQQVPEPTERFIFEDIRYKFHACCHGTHAMIEALLKAMQDHQLTLSDIGSCRVRTNPRWMSVCDIQAPETGLEIKFSYRWLAGMVLDGRPTGSISIFSDSLAKDQRLADFAGRVEVIPDVSIGDMQTKCELILSNGDRIDVKFDLEGSMSTQELKTKLLKKAAEIFGDRSKLLDPVLEAHTTLRARDIGAILQAG